MRADLFARTRRLKRYGEGRVYRALGSKREADCMLAGACPTVLCHALATAGHPVRRSLLIQSQAPLEYWLARSSRAKPAVALLTPRKNICYTSDNNHAEETPMLTLHHLNDSPSHRLRCLLAQVFVPC